MKLRSTPFALSAIALASACATSQTPAEREAQFIELSPAHFTEQLEVVDDPLNHDIRINTRPGWRDYQFSFGPRNDQFLRASLSRNGSVSILQAYVTAEANTSSALQPVSVNFEHTIELRDVDRVDLDVRSCSSSGCLYYEQMVFDLTLAEIDQLIAGIEARSDRVVRFRIQGLSGRQHDGRFHVSELRAFRDVVLARLDRP